MAQDMIKLVQKLQEHLQKGSLKDLMPFFELVGSMAEGTRIGLANELDLALKFKAWMTEAPFQVKGDPFSLKKSKSPSKFMEDFFTNEEFHFHKFMHFLLGAVDTAVSDIFEEEKNPPHLRRITTNKEWNMGLTKCKGRCKRYLEKQGFEQCKHCAVAVSQTKSGVVLQLEWGTKIYCSVDLIPVFHIEPISTMQLARLIMRNMLSIEPPEGWLNFLFKYYKDYKIVQYLSQSGDGKVTSVGLKTMTFLERRNHHVKPAQDFTRDKFASPRMKDIYTYIKFLIQVLGLDLSSYWVKKELLKEEYSSLLDTWCDNGGYGGCVDDFALVQILSQPQFKPKFQSEIDFSESHRLGMVVLWRGMLLPF